VEPDQDYNSQFVKDTIASAEQKATNAYQQGMLQYYNQQIALQKAQQAWKEEVDKAGLTGMYGGAYTMPTQQWFAQQFGTWGTPEAGQQTLAANQQQFGQGATLGQMYGQYYAPGTAPTQGQQTQAAQEQQYTQWLRSQQQALAVQKQQQDSANQYLTLLASLRGPADWAKYQQVLGAGGNMNTLAAAMMGQYIPGGGATSGYQPQAANLQTLYGQVAGAAPQAQWYGQWQPPQQQQGLTAASFNPEQQYQQAQQQYGAQAPQAQTGMLQTMEYRPQGGQPQTMEQAQQMRMQQQAAGNGTNMMGAPQQNQMNLPAPNQIAAQTWNNLAPSQKEMALGEYEAQGWHKPDVEALFNQSLPKYAANAPGAGTWRLR